LDVLQEIGIDSLVLLLFIYFWHKKVRSPLH
jgi:hypothetical protein